MYTIEEHVYRYSIWAAARAAQRGLKGFTIEKLKTILDNINFKNLVNSYMKGDIDSKTFEIFHKKIAKDIILKGAELKVNITYGRASKVISIYLKTAIIIPNSGKGKAAEVIHAPIDSILLKELSKKYSKPNWKRLTWTTFTETEYWELISDFKKNNLPINWKLEQYWNPEN